MVLSLTIALHRALVLEDLPFIDKALLIGGWGVELAQLLERRAQMGGEVGR